jgi:hypothetical protein
MLDLEDWEVTSILDFSRAYRLERANGAGQAK